MTDVVDLDCWAIRECELCKKKMHEHEEDNPNGNGKENINGFTNIAEICDGTDKDMEDYEKKYNVSLQDFWCCVCTTKALREIEKTE